MAPAWPVTIGEVKPSHKKRGSALDAPKAKPPLCENPGGSGQAWCGRAYPGPRAATLAGHVRLAHEALHTASNGTYDGQDRDQEL